MAGTSGKELDRRERSDLVSTWNVVKRLPDPESQTKKKNGELLPDSIRCLIVGPSGCGKTTLLVDNFLLAPNWLDWKNRHLYVFSKSLEQSKYQQLMKLYDGLDIATFASEIKPLDDCRENSVVVFDDVILENQNEIRNFFTQGRHKGMDCFYLAQTFSKIPKQLVRDNANFICLFRQDHTNLKHAYDDYVGGDMNYNQFSERCCSTCWNGDDFGFATIDMTRKPNDGKYRNKINDFLNVATL